MSFLDITEAPSDNFAPLPADSYKMCVDDAKFKESQSGNEYLSVVLKVLEGEKEGRLLFHNLNLFHSNEKVSGIAKSQLKQMIEKSGSKDFAFASKEDVVKKILGIQVGVKTRIKDDQAQVSYFYELKDDAPKGDIPF